METLLSSPESEIIDTWALDRIRARYFRSHQKICGLVEAVMAARTSIGTTSPAARYIQSLGELEFESLQVEAIMIENGICMPSREKAFWDALGKAYPLATILAFHVTEKKLYDLLHSGIPLTKISGIVSGILEYEIPSLKQDTLPPRT